ncbi:hypothetical protein AAV35_005045 [Salimicrobium jeotgali]|uniref:Prepilin peptidase n=1 Tax=Salimicrobium jeotgali TaxID=1230341 RepID=K2H950_9BACI|nr:A24 family peptidase [Salimicrobium jeotgali]AKG04209.1 hypothetical protein AAV35_005045 [Salimicrobium jeotgali]EKE32175.1 prepilin peptidase [Salimicrobium jeotgali]MBM7695786.1 leader peptidase (prepilin peptidase)/N-methyltransferase [Salimicrobium jeotgali]
MTAVFFVLGLVFGSFFNVVGLRAPAKSLFAHSRSYCPHCCKDLHWYELIPLLSWLFLRGKCSGCRAHISLMYPAMELFSGAYFSFAFLYHGFTPPLIYSLLLGALTHIFIVSDITSMILPSSVLITFSLCYMLYFLIDPPLSYWSQVIGGGVGAGVTAGVILLSRGGMGGGDMKLFGLLGFMMGVEKLFLIFLISSSLGALTGGLLIITKVISGRQPVPFAPFILAGACVTNFYGTPLIEWYLGHF